MRINQVLGLKLSEWECKLVALGYLLMRPLPLDNLVLANLEDVGAAQFYLRSMRDEQARELCLAELMEVA